MPNEPKDRIHVHPDELKTKEKQDAFVDATTEDLLDMIDEERKQNGLEPLAK
jgi:hypothetical protein